MLLSVIIPVFNEQSSIIEVVERALSMILPNGLDLEIVVIDDGSTDGTTELLKVYLGNSQVTVHHSILNFGKGVAVRIGLRYARGDFVAIQDADLEYDPRDVVRLVEPLLAGTCQVVFGSRYLGQPAGMTRLQDCGNQILTGCTNLLFGSRLTDAYTCHKLFSKEVSEHLSRHLRSRGFELEAELTGLILRKRYPLLELPTTYQARTRAEGKKIRARDGAKGIAWLLGCRCRPLAS